MTLYGIALFLHILAAVGIVGGSCLEHYIQARMRRARSLETLNEWIGAAKTIGKLMPIFAVTLLIFGTYMTFAVWGWRQPWIIVSLILLVAIASSAPLVLDPNLRAVERAASNGEPLSAIATILAAPVPAIASSIFTAEAVGIVLLMATKPALVATLAIVILAAVIGAILGRSRAHAPAVAADPATATPTGVRAR